MASEWLKQQAKQSKSNKPAVSTENEKNRAKTQTTSKASQWLQDLVAAEAAKKQKGEAIPPAETGSGEQAQDNTWLKGSSAWDDGYQFGDVSKTAYQTLRDAAINLLGGVTEMGEKVVDTGAYLGALGIKASQAVDPNHIFAPAWHNEKTVEKLTDFIKGDLYDGVEVIKSISNEDLVKQVLGVGTEEASVFGEKTDSLMQSAGQLAATAALQAAGVPAWLVTGVTSFGGEAESALQQGATLEQAGLSAAITAGAEVLTEQISGGIKFGKMGTLDDALTTALARTISDKTARTLLKYGIDVVGEGGEEVLSGVLSAVGQKLTYAQDKSFEELFPTEEAFDSFIAGMLLSSGSGTVKIVASNAKGVDYTSGLTPQQEAQVMQTYNDRVAEAEKSGKVGFRGKNAIYDNILGELRQGTLTGATQQPQTPATGGQQTSQQLISDALDDTIAQLTGAPADPVGAALEGFRQSGTVTNKQAADILNSARAVTALVEQTGVKLDGLTASQKRQNVKNAISQMAQNQQAEGQNESTSVNTDPAQHTPQEQSVIDDYQNAVDDNLVEYIQTVKDNPGQKMPRYPLKDVSSRAAEDIKRITGVDVSGHKTQMESRMVEHIIKDHGEHGITDQSMRDVNDIARIQYVIDNYDSIEHGGTSSAYVYQNQHGRNANAQTVVMKKKVNGTYFVVEAVPDTSKKTVFITSAYMSKDGKQKAAASLSGDAEAPRFTPKSATKNTAVDEDVMRYHKANASGAIASPSSSNNVAQRSPNVNPNESVGAAPAGFAGDFTRMQMEHGNLPQGENPVRPDDMPKSTDGNDRVSHTAVTVKGAKVTPDEFVPLLEKDVTEGGMSYIPITNSETVQKAMDKISEEGWEVALGSWQKSVERGETGADLVATGSLLLNNAAHAGDKATWLDVLHDFQQLGTNTAQGLQAFRILKKLNPSDKLYMVRRSIKQMVRDMHLGMEITVDPELETAYRNAETDEARDAVLKKIQKNVASQIPATFMEKFTKLRYVNMLGNLRTQGRNIVGNLGMKAVRSAHNAIAAGIENLAGKASGGKLQRTRSATVSKAQKAAAAKDFDGLKTAILDGGKYSDSTADTIGFARGVQEQRQIFRFKPMEGYRKVVNWAMEQGDLIFAKDAYARALAGYLKANGITETDYSKIDTAILDDARLFAAKEAQEATFRDTNWLSGWVSKVGRRKDTPAAVKAISEGIMPFRKTPANVLVRAEEYSPLGVINSIVTSVKATQSGSNVTGAQVINSWAKTLTGTGIFGLGMLLQNLGLLSAGPDEDEDKDRFDSMNGWQNYALTLPDGTNLTIDFLTPAAIPLLMGAELMQLMRNDGFSLKDIESSLSAIADPMVEMSMLQGVNDTLDNIQYADDNLGQLLINSCLSYLTQGLTNTLAGQLERTFEDSRMTTYVDKDSDLPDWLQRAIGKASAKIPGLDYNQIPYINAWGEEEENPEWYLNGAYNLLSPSYIEKGVSSDLTQELNRLNGVQSDVNVYPSAPDKSVTYNSQKYNLSAEEYVSLAKQQGQKQKALVEDILANSAYADLSDADKAKAISYAYEYARDYARMEVLPDYPGFSSKWMAELKGDIAEGIIRKTVVGTTEKYASLPIEKASYVDDLLDSILPPAGKTYATQQQKIDAVTGADGNLTDKEQRTVLKDVLSDSAYDKFLEILELGYSNDDYADSYRIYSKEKETGGKGTKARTIAAFQKKFGISENAATTLYEIYNPK